MVDGETSAVAVSLLPCPFCGGEASAEGRARYTENHEAWFADGSRVLEAFYCNCYKCGATRQTIVGGYQTRELAIAAWNTRITSTPQAASAEVREATVEDHNAAFDPADEAGGDAFRAGFREGWIFAQTPDGTDYDELTEQYGRVVDIEPSEAWTAYRDEFFAKLPLAAIPDVGAAVPSHAPNGNAGETYRHVKRGTVYEVIGRASLQNANCAQLSEAACMVIYRGDDGNLWAREESEFMDGRFEPAAASIGNADAEKEGLSAVDDGLGNDWFGDQDRPSRPCGIGCNNPACCEVRCMHPLPKVQS